jgi:hypothetical protein
MTREQWDDIGFWCGVGACAFAFGLHFAGFWS